MCPDRTLGMDTYIHFMTPPSAVCGSGDAPGLTFVTVVYEAELTMLEVQARSFDRFLPPAAVRSVYILDNSRRGMTLGRRRRVAGLFGRHAARVRFVRAQELVGRVDAGGWRSQQLLKLAVASLLGDEHYVALDAKNHFVSEPVSTFFVSRDGRARVSVGDARTARYRDQLERALDYCGLPRERMQWFPWPVTPFVLDACRVRTMMREVEQECGRPFAEEFLREWLWEFWLYAAWTLRSEPMEAVFEARSEEFLTIWPESDSREAAAVIDRVRTGQTPVLGIHRAAYENFDPSVVAALCSYWVDRGIYETLGDAADAVSRISAEIGGQRRVERRRELRRKAGRRTRRAVRWAMSRATRTGQHLGTRLFPKP